MRVPVLTRRLVLEAPVRVPDGLGGFAEVWQALGTHWAEVRPGTGRTHAEDFLTVSAVACRIVVRAAPVGHPARPRAGQRFREGVRRFPILAVTEADARGHHLLCFAREETVA